MHRVKCLMRSGWVRALYYPLRRWIAQCFKLERVPYLPPRLDVEPIDTCNFACDHCQVTHWKRLITRLKPDRFRTILDQLPRLLHVKLQGMGEPLLNRRLLDMLEEGERRGINVEIAARLSSLRGALIIFSVDGATAATFEAIRVKGNFTAVTDHIADLVRRRGKRTWPRIEIRTVATLRNAHELPDIVRLAKNLGVDRLVMTTLLTDWGKAEMRGHVGPIDVARQHDRTERFMREAESVAAALEFPVVIERGQRYSASRRCPWPWYNAYVAANGDVVPCCEIADSSVVKMGNVFDAPFPKSGITNTIGKCDGASRATIFRSTAAVATG